MESAVDDLLLLFPGQLDEIHGIAGNADGKLRVFFRVIHGVEKRFPFQYVHINVVTCSGKVGVQQGDELDAAFTFLLAQGLRNDGEGLGDAVQGVDI